MAHGLSEEAWGSIPSLQAKVLELDEELAKRPAAPEVKADEATPAWKVAEQPAAE